MTQTVVKTIGTTGVFSTPQLWEDGAPASLTTAEKSTAGTFLVATFIQGESITFVGSGATGKFLDTDSTGLGTGTYITYGLVSGNVATNDVATGATSGATCIISSGTPADTGVIWQGQCQNQEFSGTGTQITISGSTASSTRYKELTTVAGASFRDNANAQTNALQYNASNGAAIKGTSANTVTASAIETSCRVSKLQISATGTGGRGFSGTATGSFYDFLIIEGTYTGTVDAIGAAMFTNAGAGDTLRNSVVIQRASGADHIIGTGTGVPKFYNCTFVAPDDHATAPTSIFLSGASGTVTVQNCGLFAGDSTKAIKAGSATYNFTTCYSDISGTSGVTQCTYANEFQNVNDATRDFRLKAGAAELNTGTTDATNAATDIVGTTRPQGSAYDVGCWELVSTDGAASSNGTATAIGSGKSLASGAVNSTALATAIASGRSLAAGAMSSSGSATAIMAGRSAAAGAASSIGSATAIAVGKSLASGAVSAAGSATAVVTGKSTASANIASDGSATGIMEGAANAAAAGDAYSAGTSTAEAVGTSTGGVTPDVVPVPTAGAGGAAHGWAGQRGRRAREIEKQDIEDIRDIMAWLQSQQWKEAA